MKPILTSMALAFLPTLSLVSAQEIKLTAFDGGSSHWFGDSVAVSGNTAIVGAKGGGGGGSAYLYDSTDGQLIAKLLPSDVAFGDRFGSSVAISGNTAVVGAPLDNIFDDTGALIVSCGSAFVFNASTGQETSKLLASDGLLWDMLGFSVAISGATILAGAPSGNADGSTRTGCAYLFTASGQELAKLVASDGADDDGFGKSVGISGNTAIVGAPGDDDGGGDSGSAYLFDISNPSNPVQIAKLLASDGAPSDMFGVSVAISGNTAIVGAHWDGLFGSKVGAAYLFDTTTGQQTAKLVPDGNGGLFGSSVAISGNKVIVGAFHNDYPATVADTGCASIYDVTDPSAPVKVAVLVASDSATADYFGYSVAISGTTTIVGAPYDDDLGVNSGSAYLNPAQMATCASRSGILGLNPADYTSSNAPVLGATWNTQVSTSPSLGSSTLNTFVALGVGGPTEGIPVFGHELLILPPFLSFSGLGAHDFPIPSDSALIGLSDSWQGGRLETGSGFFLVLTNALDVVYGL